MPTSISTEVCTGGRLPRMRQGLTLVRLMICSRVSLPSSMAVTNNGSAVSNPGTPHGPLNTHPCPSREGTWLIDSPPLEGLVRLASADEAERGGGGSRRSKPSFFFFGLGGWLVGG